MKKLIYVLLLSISISLGTINLQAINVNVRIESYDKTLLKTSVNVEATDISSIVGGNSSKWTNTVGNKPVVTQAIVKALQDKGYNVNDHSVLNLGTSGGMLYNILGVQNGSIDSYFDGWMYTINNDFPDDGAGMGLSIDMATLNEGDSIVLFFTENWYVNAYSYFDKENIEVFDDELVNFNNYQINIMNFMFYNNKTNNPVNNAFLILEKQNKDGSYLTKKRPDIISNSSGLFSFTINEVGLYNATSWIDNDDQTDDFINELTRASTTIIVKSRALYNIINEAQAIINDNYTTSSYQNLITTLNEAETLYQNNYASSAEVNNMITALRKQIDNLEENNDQTIDQDEDNNVETIDNKLVEKTTKANLPTTGIKTMPFCMVMLIFGSGLSIIYYKNSKIN
ncbi:MAG: glycine betaine ABC transporter substrate-binding protein [Bacilli bacterium]|jgi:hypothetical protein|nr:glycine betaine ABC transporter substrate-binding protein [Bacilli bacterium]